jgi:nitrate reductase gamma subunit
MNADFLIQSWPIWAATLFGAGFVVSSVWRPKNASEGWDLLCGSTLGRSSLLALLLGHLAALLFPREILFWDRMPLRLYLLEAVAFATGLMALAGWARSAWRHLDRSAGSMTGQIADTIFLALLFSTLASGLLLAASYRWGSSWGVLTLTPHARSILRGDIAVGLPVGMPFLVRVHIFSALATGAMLPLTRLAPALIAAIGAGLAWALRPLGSSLKAGGRVAEGLAGKLNVNAWIWRDEE